MNLNQLEYFCEVAKLENYRKAAENLNVSQPSLTKAIKSLEIELNINFFDKDGRGVKLNKYGKIFLTESENILENVQEVKNKMLKLSGNNGIIDIAYVFPLAYRYIPSLVNTYLEIGKYNNTMFNFYQNYTENLITGLKKGVYDVIFSSYVPNEDDITFFPIMQQELVIITSLNHPLAEKKELDIKFLNENPVIIYDKKSGLGRKTIQIFNDYEINTQIIGESPDENAIASLVAENLGVALVANVDLLSKHNVSIHSIKNFDIVHNVYMAYNNSSYLTTSVISFINFVKEVSNTY